MRCPSQYGSRLLPSVVIATLASALAFGQATDFNGSIVGEQWLALGPFSTPIGCDGNAGLTGIYGNQIGPFHHIGCEAPEEGSIVEGYDPFDPSVVTLGIHPDAPQDVDGNPMWYAWDDGTPFDGNQDFGASPAGDLDEHMMILATYVEYLGDEPVSVEICFGSDDDGQVWIDDEIVHNVTACRGAVACGDRFFVTITPGVHVIKMAAWDQGGGSGAVLGLNVDGVPVEDGDPNWILLGREGEVELECDPEDYEVFDPPSNVTCLSNPDGSLDLSWDNHPDTDPTGAITILIDGEEVASLPGGSTEFAISSAQAGGARDFCVRSAGGLRACSFCSLVSADGLIATSAWLAIGPFNGPGCEGTPDNSLAPSFIGCEYPAAGEELLNGYDPLLAASNGVHEYAVTNDFGDPVWYAFDDGTDDGDQNFNLGVPEPDNVVQYAVTYVEYVGDDEPVDINLCIGSDDSVDVWINSERVQFLSACRGRQICQETVPVTLPGRGVYRIAVGVWDGCCGWGFSLGLQNDLGEAIFADHPDWVFHGRSRPDDLEARVPGGTDCEDCVLGVTGASCETNPLGGLTVQWNNPEDCECVAGIELKIDGEVVATVAAGAERATIPANQLPGGLFDVTITNCSGLFASCSPHKTDGQGLILTQSWMAIGPFLGPGCAGSLENQLAPSFVGCEYPELGDELSNGYDPLIAGTGGLHELAPRTEDGEPMWYAFDDGINDGDQNFNLGNPEPDNVVQYAVTYVEYTGDENPVNLNLCLGSDDSADVWVNDERVFFVSACRGRAVCQETVPVSLPGAGVYRIAVGVWDGCCGWGFSLGLQDGALTPIVDDGSNPDWVFHGRNPPDDFEGPCPDCLPPTGLFCDRTPKGLSLDWTNPADCEEEIRVLLYGEEFATLPAGTTSFQIDDADLPFQGTVEIDNGSFETAKCSFIEGTEAHTPAGFVKSWLMLGPLEQPFAGNPDCASAALDYLTDGEITEADIRPEEGDEIAPDFGGEAASTGLAPTPGNPDLNPDGVPVWTAHFDFDDTIDYNADWYFGDPDNVVVYSAFYIDVPVDVTVDVGIGSDDSLQLLVDGVEAGCVSITRGFGAADVVQDVFTDVELTAGEHLIMVKVFDGCCGHGHRLRFQKNGEPIVPGEISIVGGGVLPGDRFQRGDADGSGALNITDGIFLLNFLFLGGPSPSCGDAGDADDTGTINITDGIYLLNFLFLGGPNPGAPHPACGTDPTGDDLDCRAFAPCP